jgi:hypothetical protein
LEREEQQQAAVELAYLEYQKQELDNYIQLHFSAEEWEAMMKTKKDELLEQVYWRRIFAGKPDLLNKAAEQLIRREVSGQVKLMSFSEFREMKRKHQVVQSSSLPETIGLSSASAEQYLNEP